MIAPKTKRCSKKMIWECKYKLVFIVNGDEYVSYHNSRIALIDALKYRFKKYGIICRYTTRIGEWVVCNDKIKYYVDRCEK